MGWGLQGHFHVQPNYSVEVVLLVVLCCRWGCDNKKNIILLTFFSMKIPITKHHGHVKYGAHD